MSKLNLHKIFYTTKKQATKSIKRSISENIDNLKSVLSVSDADRERLLSKKLALSRSINNNHQGKSCSYVPSHIVFIPPEKELETLDVINFLYASMNDLSKFEEKISSSAFLESVENYLGCLRSEGLQSTYLSLSFVEVEKLLNDLEDRRKHNIQLVSESISQQISKDLRRLHADNEFLWTRYFPAPQVEKTLNTFLLTRRAIEAYSQWTSSTALEGNILDEIIYNYNMALDSMRTTEFRLEVDLGTIYLELDNRRGRFYRPKVPLDMLSREFVIYPLGRTAAENEKWIDNLKLRFSVY